MSTIVYAALGVLTLGLRIGVCVIEQALGATRTQDAAVESVRNKQDSGTLWRIVVGGRWRARTTMLRGGLHSVETVAFAALGYELGGTGGALLALGIYVIAGGFIENQARVQSWGGKKAAVIGARILQPINRGDGEGERIQTEEADMIGAVLELKKLTVSDCMVPIQDAVVVDIDSSVGEALELLIKHRLSRAPIIDSTNAIVVTLKDLIVADRGGNLGPAAAVGRKCMVVPEAKSIDSMLRDMRAGREHLAVVSDEYGTVSGIITLEDCIEAVVGEIDDEHDTVETWVEVKSDGSFQIRGGATIGEVNDYLGSQLVSEDDTTIGGIIFSKLGRSAVVGDMVQLGEWNFTVTETVRRRISSVVGRRRVLDNLELEQTEPS